ncbi:MAG: hypothetical protein L3K15_05550 [Thermoplasmata archaeon]|nr:hypothetical protein [Thermoplasmata archaeon]
MTPSASDVAPTVIFLGLLIALLGRRFYQSVRGAKLSPASLLGFAGVFFALFALTVVSGYFLYPAYGLGGLVVDAVVLVPSVYFGIRYTRRKVEVWRRPDGVWMYRMGVAIALVYLALLAARLLLDIFVIGIDPFGPPSIAPTLSVAAAASLLVVDALFAVSTGLLLGRNIGVYLVHGEAVRRGASPAPTSVPPAG